MELAGLQDAQRVSSQAMTPRARELERLDRYVSGRQYEGRKNFWDKSVPLQERAPCIKYNIVKAAIRGFRANICGEDLFPDVTSRNAWDDNEKVLLEEDSKAIDMVLAALAKQCRFQALCGETLSLAMGSRSVAVIFGIRANRLFGDTVRAQWCTPSFDRDGAVTELEIKYPYIDTNLLVDGKYKARAMWYRRVITADEDTVYIPVEFKSLNDRITWTVDAAKSANHMFGFCPVIWYAFERGCDTAGQIDGHAIHDGLLEEIEALDMLLSVKHRAGMRAEGQWTEIGVDAGYNPSSGRQPLIILPSSASGGTPTPDNPISGGFMLNDPNIDNARRSGSDEVWQYGGDAREIKVERHAMRGDALKAMEDVAKDHRNKLGELLSVVFMDPENLPHGTAMSGTALMALRKRFFERCNEVRSDFGDNFIVPAYGMMLRIAAKVGLRVPGSTRSMQVVDRLGDLWSYLCPPLELSWGDYARPDPAEGLLIMQTVQAGLEAKLLTTRQAIKMLRTVVGIEDVDGYIKELEKHVEDQQEKEASATEQTAGIDHQRALELVTAKAKVQGATAK
jgi:hypothetical protein